MTTFAEIEEGIVGLTRRPEIPNITKLAVRDATLRAHHVNFFPADTRTTTITYPVPGGNVTLIDIGEISTKLVRQRGLQAVQGVDPSTYALAERFSYYQPDQLYDDCNQLRTSVYTIIGDTLRLIPATPTGALAVYYYQNPVTTEGGYSSWIADLYPDDIIQWGAAIVSARTGFREIAEEIHNNHIKPFRETLEASHFLVEVH